MRTILASGIAWLATLALTSSAVHAAGCHYGTTSGSIAADVPSGVVQVYIDGQLRLYRPAKLPCSGPHCDGSVPDGLATSAVIVPDDRSDSLPLGKSANGYSRRSSGYAEFDSSSLYAHLACTDILRPPRG